MCFSHLPKIYQSFLMSATFTEDVQALKELLLHNPVMWLPKSPSVTVLYVVENDLLGLILSEYLVLCCPGDPEAAGLAAPGQHSTAAVQH